LLVYYILQTCDARKLKYKKKYRILNDEVKGKGNVQPRTGHEGPEGEHGDSATPRPLYPRARDPVPIV